MKELEKIFFPSSIAVIGASQNQAKVGHAILANLIDGGYQGDIVPIHPDAGELLGLPVYSSLSDYGQPVDLAVIAVNRDLVFALVQEALNQKVGAIIVVASGFREQGKDGEVLEERLADLCKRDRVVLLGPNSLGVINTESRMNASFAGPLPRKGRISFFSQSGALCAAMLDMVAEKELGLAKLISVGNKADVNEVDIFEYLLADEDTDVVVGYLEDIVSGNSFMKAAEELSAVKPVILLKSGVTGAGKMAVASHTGSLVGADTAYGAAFKRAGICRADNFSELLDYAAFFTMQPLPKGNRVLIITNAGGPGVLAADATEKAGLQVACLCKETQERLTTVLEDSVTVTTIVDVLGDGGPERYRSAVAAGIDDESVDAILVILTPQAMTDPDAVAVAIAEIQDGAKPILVSFMGGKSVFSARKELVKAGLPDYPTPERAVSALNVAYQRFVWQNRPPRLVTRFPVNRRRVERIIHRRQKTGRLFLNEIKAKDILKAYGFKVMSGRLATTAEEAVEIAGFIGFPVALKIVSAQIVHKTDLGGVSLNLASAREVEDAFDLMNLRIRKNAPEAVIDGVYVEKMAEPGLEVILGMTRDPQFGPMLMFGLGGIFVEVMKDITFHLAPITEEEAVQMLQSTRSYEMLQGKRGNREVDIYTIARSLQRVSQLTTDFPQIVELDINPLIVGGVGDDPVVADARMTITPMDKHHKGKSG